MLKFHSYQIQFQVAKIPKIFWGTCPRKLMPSFTAISGPLKCAIYILSVDPFWKILHMPLNALPKWHLIYRVSFHSAEVTFQIQRKSPWTYLRYEQTNFRAFLTFSPSLGAYRELRGSDYSFCTLFNSFIKQSICTQLSTDWLFYKIGLPWNLVQINTT